MMDEQLREVEQSILKIILSLQHDAKAGGEESYGERLEYWRGKLRKVEADIERGKRENERG